MFYNIDVHSGKPIYLQLKEQIKKAIASGRLPAGDKLPPVREMAMELKINPNTVARAYRELKEEGFLRTARGRGTFACRPSGELDEQGLENLRGLLRKVMVEAYQRGVSREILEEKFYEALSEWEDRLE